MERRPAAAGTYQHLRAYLKPLSSYVRRAAIQIVFFSAIMPFISWTHLYLCTGRDIHSVPPFSAPVPYSVDVPHESGPEGQMEFCRKGRCNGRWKPPGTHHCSTCGTCRMGFDHHCPWVACFFCGRYIAALIYRAARQLCLFQPHEGFSGFALLHCIHGPASSVARPNEGLATRSACFICLS